MMKKSGVFLAIVGSLIAVGIILSFYGNYVIFEDLKQGDADVGFGESLIVEVDLDPNKSSSGIYAVQILDFKGGTITANIVDPFNSIIESQTINEELYEGLFDLTTVGTYKLVVENSGETVKIFGVIGPEPDSGKRSLNIISLYILVVGLVGMAGVAVYIVVNRKKSAS